MSARARYRPWFRDARPKMFVEHHLVPVDDATQALYGIDEIGGGGTRAVRYDDSHYPVMAVDTVYFLRDEDRRAFRKYTDRVAEAMHHELFFRAVASQNDAWLHEFVAKRNRKRQGFW